MMDQEIEAALMRAGAQVNALQENERRLLDKLYKVQQQRDEMRGALELIKAKLKIDDEHELYDTVCNALLFNVGAKLETTAPAQK